MKVPCGWWSSRRTAVSWISPVVLLATSEDCLESDSKLDEISEFEEQCCSIKNWLNSICLWHNDTRQNGVAVVYFSDNEWMDESLCSLVTEGLAYCLYLAQPVRTRTNHASNVKIHLQFLVDNYTQVDNAGNCCSSSCLLIFASWTRVPIHINCVLLGSASTDLKTSSIQLLWE